jgi:hypothetical protein
VLAVASLGTLTSPTSPVLVELAATVPLPSRNLAVMLAPDPLKEITKKSTAVVERKEKTKFKSV